jgi:hypothetical protein
VTFIVSVLISGLFFTKVLDWSVGEDHTPVAIKVFVGIVVPALLTLGSGLLLRWLFGMWADLVGFLFYLVLAYWIYVRFLRF